MVGSRYFLCFAILLITTRSIDCVKSVPQGCAACIEKCRTKGFGALPNKHFATQIVFLYRRKHCLRRLCVLSGHKHQSHRPSRWLLLLLPLVLALTVLSYFISSFLMETASSMSSKQFSRFFLIECSQKRSTIQPCSTRVVVTSLSRFMLRSILGIQYS